MFYDGCLKVNWYILSVQKEEVLTSQGSKRDADMALINIKF